MFLDGIAGIILLVLKSLPHYGASGISEQSLLEEEKTRVAGKEYCGDLCIVGPIIDLRLALFASTAVTMPPWDQRLQTTLALILLK